MRSGECRRTQQTAAEACAFLIGPIHEADRDWRTAAELFVNSAQHFETCEHVERTIEPTAVGDRIEMPADQQRFFGCARQRDPVVSSPLIVMFNTWNFLHLS